MKNKGIIVPIALAGIVLILILVTAITKKDFKKNPAEILLLSKSNSHIIGTDAISALPADQITVLKIGKGNVSALFSKAKIIELGDSNLLSSETKAIFADNTKTKILTSTNISDAVKAWTFFTRLGYNNLRIYDPDLKKTESKYDSILQGNEAFQYTFKPEVAETE